MRWRGAGRAGADRPPRRHQLDGAVHARRPAGVGARRARLPAGHADAVEEGGHGAVPAQDAQPCTPTTAATRASPARPCSSSPRPARSSPTPRPRDAPTSLARCCCSPGPGPPATSRRSSPSTRAARRRGRRCGPTSPTARRAAGRPTGRRAAGRGARRAGRHRTTAASSSAAGRWAGGSARWSPRGADGDAAARRRSPAWCSISLSAAPAGQAGRPARRAPPGDHRAVPVRPRHHGPVRHARRADAVDGDDRRPGHPPLDRRQGPRPQGSRRRGRRRWWPSWLRARLD